METKRTRRSFSPELKKQAAQRVLLLKEAPASVAAELAIKPEMLTRWIREYEAQVAADPSHAIPAKSEKSSNIRIIKKKPAESTAAPDSESDLFSPLENSTPAIEPTPVETKEEAPLEQIHTKQDAESVKAEEEPKVEVRNEAAYEPTQSFKVRPERQDRQDRPVRKPNPAATERSEREYPAQKDGSYNPKKQNNKPQRNNPNNPRNNRNEQVERNQNAERMQQPVLDEAVELVEAPVQALEPPKPKRPVPKASEGRRWRVAGVLAQRPNYREENENYGYVDEFSIPAEDLDQVWEIIGLMQEKADSRAFGQMVHERGLNVPDEVMFNPRAMVVSGPNIPNKPWLRKPRMHPIAEDFFQTTPDYTKAIYETYEGLDIRLEKNSDGTPILSIEKKPDGKREITIDFSKFDRFVDDFYGTFVRDCKKVMMEQNPKEYPGLNAFIRIPDEPMWNPKLWAGVRTFEWNPGEELSRAWIRYASSLRRNSRNRR